MPQPLPVGTVLGGRYRITDHVVTSADQDMVFHGADQVLNRRVTVLVASAENATQVASSARELATGERQDDIQVLDLGLSEGRTYLIAGGDPDPDVLLGLAYPQELHVEPFQTDTLGSEIFGQSRTGEAHSYDDDDAYYADLDRRLRADEAKTQRRPGFLNRISERINERVRPADGTAAKAAAGASALAAADAATRAQQEERERAEREAAERAEREAREAEERARREEAERAEQERREAEEARERAAEEEQARREQEEQAEREAAERAEAERLERERRQAEAEEAARAEREAREAEEARRVQEERKAAEPATEAVPVVDERDEDRTQAVPVVDTRTDGDVPAGATADTSTESPAAPTPADDAPTEDAERTQATPVVAPAAPARRPRPAPRRALRDEAAEWRAGLGAGTGAAADRDGAADPARTGASGERAAAGGAGGSSAAPAGTAPAADEPARASSGRSWLLALLLVGALVLAGLVGLFLLGQNTRSVAPSPASSSPAQSEEAASEAAPADDATSEAPSSEAAAQEETSAAAAAPAAVEPRPVAVERRVAEMPELEAENDDTLSNLIDGDPGTAWQSYAYNRPNFGGYVDSMNVVVELEQPAQIEEVVVQSAGGTGGSWIAYIADSPEGGPGDAREIGQGTFDEGSVAVPVEVEDSTAQYVILSLTSLPQIEDGAEHPYGLQLTEIEVR